MRDKEHPDHARNHMIAKLDLLFLHSSKEKALPKDVRACQLSTPRPVCDVYVHRQIILKILGYRTGQVTGVGGVEFQKKKKKEKTQSRRAVSRLLRYSISVCFETVNKYSKCMLLYI